MPLETWLVFLPACFALNLSFGPNNLLALTNSVRAGVGTAVAASAGRLLAFAAMIALAAFGLGVVLAASELAFAILKWVGAAYLVHLGVRLVLSREPVLGQAGRDAARPFADLVRQEFLVAAGNPKAILVFTAFFPQFLAPGQPAAQSFAVMGATFLILELVAVAIYAVAGRRLVHVIRRGHALAWFNRVCGSLLVGFGVALALSRRPTA